MEGIGTQGDHLFAVFGEIAKISGEDGGADENFLLLLEHEIKFIIGGMRKLFYL